MDVSLTRRPPIRTGGPPGRSPRGASVGGDGLGADGAPVAVVAATAVEARRAAAALGAHAPAVRLVPASLAAYLASAGAPARVILCAMRGPAPRSMAFLGRAARRLLWPAPSEDIDSAIGGLRESHASPSEETRAFAARRTAPLRVALLLEGRVDAARTRAALASEGPRDWIVESPRHVGVPESGLARLAREGVRWSVLEPVELLAVYAGASVARALPRRTWFPRGTPIWIMPRPDRR